MNDQTYQCPVCGFHYRDEETARKCEAWCREHNSCNLEIVKEAIENQAAGKHLKNQAGS